MVQGKKDFSKKLYPLTKEERALLSPKDCWLFKIEGKIYGPYSLKNLQAYLASHPHYPPSTQIQNEADKTWIEPHQVVHFERRKDFLSTEGGPSNLEESLYLLIDGQKHGPLSLKEVEEKIAEKSALLSDYWSTTGHSAWKKIFEHPHFNRRKTLELPSIPFQVETEENPLPPPTPKQRSLTVLAGLFDGIKRGKSISKSSTEGEERAEASPKDKKKLTQEQILKVALAFSVALFVLTGSYGLYLFFFQSSSLPDLGSFAGRQEKTQKKARIEDRPQYKNLPKNSPAPPPPPPPLPSEQNMNAQAPAPTYEPPRDEDAGEYREDPQEYVDNYQDENFDQEPQRDIASDEERALPIETSEEDIRPLGAELPEGEEANQENNGEYYDSEAFPSSDMGQNESPDNPELLESGQYP